MSQRCSLPISLLCNHPLSPAPIRRNNHRFHPPLVPQLSRPFNQRCNRLRCLRHCRLCSHLINHLSNQQLNQAHSQLSNQVQVLPCNRPANQAPNLPLNLLACLHHNHLFSQQLNHLFNRPPSPAVARVCNQHHSHLRYPRTNLPHNLPMLHRYSHRANHQTSRLYNQLHSPLIFLAHSLRLVPQFSLLPSLLLNPVHNLSVSHRPNRPLIRPVSPLIAHRRNLRSFQV